MMTDYWRTELKKIADKCADSPGRVTVDELRNAILFLYEIVKNPEFAQQGLEDAVGNGHNDDAPALSVEAEADD